MKPKYGLLTLILLISCVTVASSCPVCYGQTDAHTASAVNGAIFSMLIVVGAVLSFFASFIIYLRKRMRLLATTDNTNNLP